MTDRDGGWRATPLVPIAVAFGAGVATTRWLGITAWYETTVGAIVLGLAAVPCRRETIAALGLIVAVVGVGALRATPMALDDDHVARTGLPRAGRLTGRIASEPVTLAADRARFIVDVEQLDGEPRSGLVQVSARGDLPALAEGQRIALDARLRRPSGFQNPGGFDYAAFLAREEIHAVATADGVTLLDARLPWNVRAKQAALASIRRALPPVSAGLLAGLLLGTRTELPPATLDDFRRAGVYHVLAVSGFNVALVASATFAAAMLAGASRRIGAVAAIVVVVGFAAVVGPQASVLRAAIMGVLVLAALLLERDASVVNSLALAALVILAIRPNDLVDPGFQLSFAATAGIVLAPMPHGAIAAALAVSLAAQLAVLPISLTHFNQVSVVGIVANLGVVPLAGIATVVGLVAVVLATASDVVAAPLYDAVWPVLLALRAVVRMAAAVPGALVHLPAPHWTATVTYVVALLSGIVAWRTRHARRPTSRAAAGLALVSLTIAVAIAAWPVLHPGDDRLRIAILDVGQGDAIVIQSPDRRTMLVDAGAGGPGRLDIGERVVAPFLWNRGVLGLAAAIATHDDVDHAGGMASIRRLFRIEAGERDVAAGQHRWLGPVGVSFFRWGEAGGPRNDQSLVIRVQYVDASFLLMADAGRVVERAILDRYPRLSATVLKVAHHGARSATTAEFLDGIRPRLAVLSVGARNAYHHPSPLTLARLDAAAAAVYRTDRDGAILLETDGRVLEVTRWADRHVDRYCLRATAGC